MSYIGVGGSGEMSLRNADSARKVLNSTFLVQEYVEGGNLRRQVLEQVCLSHSPSLKTYCLVTQHALSVLCLVSAKGGFRLLPGSVLFIKVVLKKQQWLRWFYDHIGEHQVMSKLCIESLIDCCVPLQV